MLGAVPRVLGGGLQERDREERVAPCCASAHIIELARYLRRHARRLQAGELGDEVLLLEVVPWGAELAHGCSVAVREANVRAGVEAARRGDGRLVRPSLDAPPPPNHQAKGVLELDELDEHKLD